MQDYQEWMQLAEMHKGGNRQPDSCIATFHERFIEDPKETAKQGRLVGKMRTFVQIRIPGDPRSVIDEQVRSSYRLPEEDPRLRFPAAYQRFLSQDKGEADGTPIDSFPGLSAQRFAELKYLNIHTVESLAAVHDGNLPHLGHDGRALRDRARQWLQGSGETEQELRGEVGSLKAEIATLQAQLRQLMSAPKSDEVTDQPEAETAEDDENDTPARRGPGRPRKAA